MPLRIVTTQHKRALQLRCHRLIFMPRANTHMRPMLLLLYNLRRLTQTFVVPPSCPDRVCHSHSDILSCPKPALSKGFAFENRFYSNMCPEQRHQNFRSGTTTFIWSSATANTFWVSANSIQSHEQNLANQCVERVKLSQTAAVSREYRSIPERSV